MDKELQKQEAIQRMKALSLMENVIQDFEKEDILYLSEGYGALFWLDDTQKEYVAEFETEYQAVVYHVIHNNTEFGELLAFLYVSNEKDEWADDREDIKEGCPLAYVKNLDEPAFSEFGSIGVMPQYGGLVRTA